MRKISSFITIRSDHKTGTKMF